MNKKVIIIIAILIIVVIIIVANLKGKNSSGNENDNDSSSVAERFDMNNVDNVRIDEGVKKNVSSKVAESKTYETLTLSDVKLESNSQTGITEFTATVTNKDSENFETKNVNIIFLNEDGTELGRMVALIEDLQPNESTQVSSFSALDIANAYDIKIEEYTAEEQ